VTRLTLRLPEDLTERLRAESQRTGISLNQLIVAALWDALKQGRILHGEQDPLKEQVRLYRIALGDLVADIDVSKFPKRLRPGPLDLYDETRLAYLPKLDPPLSATIIEEREEQRY